MALTKRGGDKQDYPASAFLYVPDKSKPTTWKIRVKEFVDGRLKVTRSILGMALAALTKGFRGNVADIPPAIRKRLAGKVRGMMTSLGISKEQVDEVITRFIETLSERQIVEQVTEGFIYDTFEEVSLSPGTNNVEIDRDKGILKNVAILGLISRNRRQYQKEAVKDAVARKVYEGLPCYKDHAKDRKPRSVDDAIGTWANTRWDEPTQKVRGDLVTLEWYRNRIFDFADNGPTLAAPSHVIEGRTRKKKDASGQAIEAVEYIGKVHSVDLVSGAATVDSLLESEDDILKEVRKMTVDEKILEKYINENTSETDNSEIAGLLKGLKEDLETLRTENAVLKKSNDEAEKVAYQGALKEALKASKLPEAAQTQAYDMWADEVKDAAGIKTIVEQWQDLAKAFVTKGEPRKPKVDVPTEGQNKTDKNTPTTLKEAFVKMGHTAKKTEEKKD